jgi:hypothetical protein
MNSDEFVKVEIEGRTYSATYQVRGRLVTVRTADGQKSTNAGSDPAEVIAVRLLRELVREEKARPDPME